jgi:8-oxo-dGTP diphosphatase
MQMIKNGEYGMESKIILQNSAVAFLKHEGCYLLMKRSPNRSIAPGLWSGVGGHIEPHELNDPKSACLREIYEETGIKKENIFNLELRYVIIRRAKDTLRQNYVYFGETDIAKVIDTDEGTLHWIDENELLNREFTKTFDAMMKHYIYYGGKEKRVIFGVAENSNGEPRMNWSVVEDFE